MADLLYDRFRLIKLLGSGGTAEVYEARDVRLGRRVAVKRVLVGDHNRQGYHARLLREARSLASVSHPNVVSIHDFFESPRSVSIVMELVRGAPLLRLMRKKAIPVAEFLGYFEQLVAALGCVHEAGLIHRDVNPRNVLIERRGLVKLIDFGLATAPDEEKPRRGGTLGYMAPEVLRRDGRPSFAADIYSLGFLAYQALLGISRFKKLYGASRPRDWARWVLSREPFRPLNELSPALDEDLSKVVGRMVEKDPAARYSGIAALRVDLERLAAARRSESEGQVAPRRRSRS